MRYFYFLLNLPVFGKVKAKKTTRALSWLFSIIAVSTVTGFIFLPLSFIYIGVCGISILYIFLQGKIKFDAVYLLMNIAFWISAFMAIDDFFNPIQRCLLFSCISLLCTPCISSPTAIIFRTLICRNILILLSFLSIGSFFCYFLGINYMPINLGRSDLIGNSVFAGLFSGLYQTSMQLGLFAALPSFIFLNSYLAQHKKIFIILFFMCASATVLSASRGATLSLVVPIVYSILFMNNCRGYKSRLIGIIVAVVIISLPISDILTAGLLEKQQRNIEAGSALSSRSGKWENRITEFQDYPFTGVGFCSIDKVKNAEDHNSTIIEPGSSHLSVLSMTGILGFVFYFLVIIKAFCSVRKGKDDIARFRMCLLLSFITHASFEGYALFAGSMMCFLYWLVIAQCEDYKYFVNRLN